jgi:hypothetical protein
MNAHPLVRLSSIANWTCTSSARKLVANGVPDHDVGPFHIQADLDFKIATQAISFSVPIAPVLTETAKQLGGPQGDTGFMLNGVKIDPGTGGSCNDSGSNCTLLGVRVDGGWRRWGKHRLISGQTATTPMCSPAGSTITTVYLRALSRN